MNVSPINSNSNNNPSFKAIYVSNNKFSKLQNVVKKDIIDKLRKPYKDNMTYEQYFAKAGKDFFIDTEKSDYVRLSILTGAKKGEQKPPVAYDKKIHVGYYHNPNKMLKHEDLLNAETNYKGYEYSKQLMLQGLGYLGILGVLVGGFLMGVKNNKTLEETTKPKIEIMKTDSLNDSIKPIVEKTVKVLKHK